MVWVNSAPSSMEKAGSAGSNFAKILAACKEELDPNVDSDTAHMVKDTLLRLKVNKQAHSWSWDGSQN